LVDALGPTAYYDGCHRSRSDETKIGGGVIGKNLACSGASTADFYDDGTGHPGQATLLQSYAGGHNVKLVVISIGGNDFGFGDIVQDCVADFLYSSSSAPDHCKDDSIVTTAMASSTVTAVTAAIRRAILRIHTAMKRAGYTGAQFTILVQDYPSPIPGSSGFRYPQSGYTRQSTGGCGFWDADADYANATILPTIDDAVFAAADRTRLANVRKLEIRSAFNGRRLCENTVDRVDDTAYPSWSAPGAVDHIEWVQGIRTVTASFSDYSVQESLHPDYLAQLALRSCVRQAYNAGRPRGGTCSRSADGVNGDGEPNMTLGQLP
jgi:hypothetical protein